MEGIAYKLGNIYRSVASSIMPLPKESQFLETGTLTPDEFVQAGDQLVHRCPTWAWSNSAPNYEQKHLPPNKQFLITRGVPSRRRISSIKDREVNEHVTQDGWLVTEVLEPVEESPPEIEEITDPNSADQLFTGTYIVAEEPESNFIPTRIYDLSVTYDTYYQTPRLWLSGFDESVNPLSPEQMFEDIMEDYAYKTVTVERHPCLGTNQVSIHPCNHSKMLKHFIDILSENGTQAQVHHALFVFLKFLSSVVPTIEYDFTMDLSLE